MQQIVSYKNTICQSVSCSRYDETNRLYCPYQLKLCRCAEMRCFMSASYDITIGDVLRELRTFHDYRQKDLSDYLNITSQAYSNYENNKRIPDIETLRMIADFYHMSLDRLLSCRATGQLEDESCYNAGRNVFRGVTDNGLVIPLSAKQAKMVTDILSLSKEQQDVCQKMIEFMKKE